MAQQTEKTLEIWTDGACKCNPGIGGWGAYMVWGAHTREMYGGSKLTTNNQMELTAVISALSALRRKCPIIIHTDSSYVEGRHHEVDPRLEAQRLANRRQEASQECGALAAA